MGFDAVDRQFQRREIKPECAHCQKQGGDVKTRYPGEDDEMLLCMACYLVRECEAGWPGI